MAIAITGFEADPNHVVTLTLTGMTKAATKSSTRISIGGRPQPAPLSVEWEAGMVVFDASGCNEDGYIEVEIKLPLGSQRAVSAEEYHAKADGPDHEAADETSVTINSVRPGRAKAGDRVTVRGKNFERLTGIQLGFVKVNPLNKAGDTATFTVPTTIKAGPYPIKFREQNAATVVTSQVRLVVEAAEGTD